MLRTPARSKRAGAAMVEAAIILPLTLFLLFGLIVGAMGIFRYQEVAFLAREGARYAVVHGKTYEKEVKRPASAPEDVYNNAISPHIITLDRSLVTYDVTWDKNNYPYTVTNYEQPTANSVSVTVTYQWFPELYLVGPFTFTSTSTMVMNY